MWNAVDRLLEKAIGENAFPGCAIAAGQRGKVLYTNVSGYLVRDGERLVKHSTRYDVGALTQVLVTMPLCMIAVERGLLGPEDTVDRFLPEVPADKKNITVAQLLTQTSGLSPHFLLQEEARSDKDALGALLRHPLASPVGGKVSDSGMGFLLLGFLLEKVFDMPLDEAAKRFVTAPLHMNHTGYLPSGSDVAPTSIRDDNGVLQPGCPLDGNARFLQIARDIGVNVIQVPHSLIHQANFVFIQSASSAGKPERCGRRGIRKFWRIRIPLSQWLRQWRPCRSDPHRLPCS